MDHAAFEWTIEYWDGAPPVRIFTSRDGAWADAPPDNVIRVRLQRRGLRPHGNPALRYTQTKEGPDHYYLIDGPEVVRLGGWNDDGRPSHEITWFHDGRAINLPRTQPPLLPPALVKHGIWVPEPWATRLGLSGGVSRDEWERRE